MRDGTLIRRGTLTVPQTCIVTGDHNIKLQLYQERNTIYDAGSSRGALSSVYLRLNNNNIPPQASCRNIV